MTGKEEVMGFFKAKNLFQDFIETRDSTVSSAEAARVIGCEVGEIAKSIVFDCEGDAVLVILEGDKKVDVKKLEEFLGKTVKKADAGFIDEKTGFEPGGVAPVRNDGLYKIIIDGEVFDHESVWVSAGTKNAVVKIKTEGFAEALSAEITLISC